MDLDKIRNDFPFLKRGIIYFDNAASSQKPRQVIDAIKEFYEMHYANVHRGIHKLSEEATDAYEKARENIARFINAQPDEIVFTKNSTEALNLIAYSIFKTFPESTIVSTVMEHHSNFVPWQQLCKEHGWPFKVLKINREGKLLFENIGDVFAITHASNVLGTINDLKAIKEDIGDKILVGDGSQAVPHLKVDVKKMDIDVYAFTGHKMLGPTGIGVLYVKSDLLKRLKPFLYGGDMIARVYIDKTIFAEPPARFEAGTPMIAQAIGLSKAVDYLKSIGMDNVRKHEIGLLNYAMKRMEEVKGLEIIGPDDVNERTGLIAFNINGFHPHDIASFLDKHNIAVRSGMHCAHPLHDFLGLKGSVRASFYIYNTKEEIDRFIEALQKLDV